MEAPIATDEVIDSVAELVDALGRAWTTFQLYPDPTSQPVYVRAAETLQKAPVYPLHIEVGPGVFSWRGEELEVSRDGVERLAKRLFLHDTAAVELATPPALSEVTGFFAFVARDEADVKANGGLAALAETGVTSMHLVPRRLLVDQSGEGDVEVARDPAVAELIEKGADPDALADELVAEAAGDAGHLVDRFVSWYVDVYERLDGDDFGGKEEVVRIFVETFFYLPDAYQVPLAGRFLRDKDDFHAQTFLDQFAGHELAELAPELDEQTNALLLEYARIATDSADGRPGELLALLQSAPQVKEARRAVAEQVEAMLAVAEDGAEAKGESFANLRAQIPEQAEDFATGADVLRTLLAIEDREPRFLRVLRIWTGRVAASIRDGDLDRAEAWLRAVLSQPSFRPENEAAVESALADLASPELIEWFVGQIHADDHEAGSRLVEAWGSALTPSLVDALAAENDSGRRRILVDLLATACREGLEPILPSLADSRWYLVRNLATAMGKSGRSDAIPHLQPLLAHDDQRVRAEALRALMPLAGAAATSKAFAALQDPHERVRSVALSLLQSSEAPGVDDELRRAVMSRTLGTAERRRIIAVLGERATEEARRILDRLASRRLVIRSSTRLVRDAARQAIAEMS